MSQLRDYIDYFDSNCTFEIAVVGTNVPDSIVNMVGKVFGDNSVEVYDGSIEGAEEELLLFRNGELVARSPLQEVSDSLLMVNSDLYKTGTADLEDIKTPDVIKELEGERFVLRGYPESNYEKLMLILISRHIEKLSYSNDDSVHRASFQWLSRINDEKGTHRVYQKLLESGTDVHVYGVPNWTKPDGWNINVHEDLEKDYIDYWFVTHRSPKNNMALLAVQTDDNTWDSLWTSEEHQVRKIENYIHQEFDR